MMIKSFTFRIITITILICFTFLQTKAQDYKVGDKSDGSKFNHVHLLKLHDYDGNTIDPSDPFAQPFSTKKTCATECHSYEKISKGFHFNYHDSALTNSSPSEPGYILIRQLFHLFLFHITKVKVSFLPKI